jgi:adenylate cyclase
LIVSESTREGLEGIVLRTLDRVQVKGKNEPVDIYEPVGESATVSAKLLQEVEESNRAMTYYFAADWVQACSAFQALDHAHPERKMYGLYLERIQTLEEQGIMAGWDGAFRHTSK